MEFIDVGKLIKNLNPVNGCTLGCPYCYAKRINSRFHITPVWKNPQFMEQRLKRFYTKKPTTFLLTSMSDFSDWKAPWQEKVFACMAENAQHTYLFLTKRPEKIHCATQLPNAWFGVTVTAQNEKNRITQMVQHITAQKYFITFEPLFGPMGALELDKIGWVVIGTETGNRKGKITAQKEWVLQIAAQAREKNIPVFMKKGLADIVGEENMLQQLPAEFR